jgi:hypothetical protein
MIREPDFRAKDFEACRINGRLFLFYINFGYANQIVVMEQSA